MNRKFWQVAGGLSAALIAAPLVIPELFHSFLLPLLPSAYTAGLVQAYIRLYHERPVRIEVREFYTPEEAENF